VVAPAANLAFVFPGQASQKAGMAAELLAQESVARATFDQASEVLGLNLAELCTTGSDEVLTRTDIAQPALLTTSAAWLAVLRERGLAPRIAAGHSLGEFGAWVAAGVLDFEQAVRLVRRRGELMEESASLRPGGMLAVIGVSDAQVEEACKKAGRAGVVVPANFNSPGQVVVSGEMEALYEVRQAVKAARGQAIPLRVSGAFHSPLMEDAAHSFSEIVAKLPLSDPQIPVVANATAELVTTAEQARQAMAKQMTSPVLWTASVQRMMKESVDLFVEVGPGQVLTKLIRRISEGAHALSVRTPDELQVLLQEVKQ
jgi:[acyl-carrier-protein] S-malonyltransferase